MNYKKLTDSTDSLSKYSASDLDKTPKKDIKKAAKALGLTDVEAASWAIGPNFVDYKESDLQKGEKAAKKYLGEDVYNDLDDSSSDSFYAVLRKANKDSKIKDAKDKAYSKVKDEGPYTKSRSSYDPKKDKVRSPKEKMNKVFSERQQGLAAREKVTKSLVKAIFKLFEFKEDESELIEKWVGKPTKEFLESLPNSIEDSYITDNDKDQFIAKIILNGKAKCPITGNLYEIKSDTLYINGKKYKDLAKDVVSAVKQIKEAVSKHTKKVSDSFEPLAVPENADEKEQFIYSLVNKFAGDDAPAYDLSSLYDDLADSGLWDGEDEMDAAADKAVALIEQAKGNSI